MGNLSQEWQDHPECSEARPVQSLQRSPETKQELPQTQEQKLANRAAWGEPAELLVPAASCRQSAVHSSLWAVGEKAQMWVWVWEPQVTCTINGLISVTHTKDRRSAEIPAKGSFQVNRVDQGSRKGEDEDQRSLPGCKEVRQ